ncbi:DUF4065 domain-containing protein [Clostridium perfringens]|uniref:Panacea domain-containing protein n=1 Tax=Clostridium perfringens TaxID=1502 RepID=UPI00214D94A2|nr:type II toxin-antitoxin system antitoxin SocA domain-containing protein [Clostridium perfringens]EIF5083658.1 DUF4065 domain-containing protein [Clostridium perfringens]EIW6614065.1 DUF4065 domain-containing protein [Clostridium perfringens]MCX0414354.1 DUF4065 domain-containing protein [Clostridium perfringens]MDK0541249.1 DUF4065 domain-containing protein [Clostridium perfringens]MDK0680298.1 DUF4065 domain-containing protein [Clostridium perfringens]
MYDAMDIAEYVLDYCENIKEKPITNLQLQKILYYIQGKFIKKTKKPIFDNSIEAWQYGPVVPEVYYWFNKFVSEPITGVEKSKNVKFSNEEIKLIEEVISENIDLDPWQLVKKTHDELPWKKNYVSNLNLEISYDDLKNFFDREN